MRYSRHLILPEVGMEGQLKLKKAKIFSSALVDWARPWACISQLWAWGVSALWISMLWIVQPPAPGYSRHRRPRPQKTRLGSGQDAGHQSASADR